MKRDLGALENHVVNLDILLNTPSVKLGFSPKLENEVRIVTCNFIDSASILLKLPQIAAATAQILIQRFFFMSSIDSVDLFNLMGGALYLASKLEESPRRLREILTVMDYLRKRSEKALNTLLDIGSEMYFTYRDGLLAAEIRILASVGFNVHVEHPHGFLLHYLSSLELAENKPLCQMALNYLHDSYRTIIPCMYQSQTIAAAVIFLAARKSNVALVENPPWYIVFDSKLEDLELISELLLALYAQTKSKHLTLEMLRREFKKN